MQILIAEHLGAGDQTRIGQRGRRSVGVDEVVGAVGCRERTGTAERDVAGDDQLGGGARPVELDLPGIVDRPTCEQSRAVLDLDRAGVEARARSGAVEHREGDRGVFPDIERCAGGGAEGEYGLVGVAGHRVRRAGRRDHGVVDAARHGRTVWRGPIAGRGEIAVCGGMPGDGFVEHRDLGAAQEPVARHAELVAVGEPEDVVQREQGRVDFVLQRDRMIAVGDARRSPLFSDRKRRSASEAQLERMALAPQMQPASWTGCLITDGQ